MQKKKMVKMKINILAIIIMLILTGITFVASANNIYKQSIKKKIFDVFITTHFPKFKLLFKSVIKYYILVLLTSCMY